MQMMEKMKKEIVSYYVGQASLSLIVPPVSASIVLGLYTCDTIFSCSLKAAGDKDACLYSHPVLLILRTVRDVQYV